MSPYNYNGTVMWMLIELLEQASKCCTSFRESLIIYEFGRNSGVKKALPSQNVHIYA